MYVLFILILSLGGTIYFKVVTAVELINVNKLFIRRVHLHKHNLRNVTSDGENYDI